jgi:hypothetical protein
MRFPHAAVFGWLALLLLPGCGTPGPPGFHLVAANDGAQPAPLLLQVRDATGALLVNASLEVPAGASLSDPFPLQVPNLPAATYRLHVASGMRTLDKDMPVYPRSTTYAILVARDQVCMQFLYTDAPRLDCGPSVGATAAP